MNKEELTIVFKDQTRFRISEGQLDITTGKIVVNGIEITSVEDWEKVTKSSIDLQQRIDKTIEYINNGRCGDYCDGLSADDLLEILGGKE